jgi:hypothetical protein
MALTQEFSNWFRKKIRDDVRDPDTKLGENLHALMSVVLLRTFIVPYSWLTYSSQDPLSGRLYSRLGNPMYMVTYQS